MKVVTNNSKTLYMLKAGWKPYLYSVHFIKFRENFLKNFQLYSYEIWCMFSQGVCDSALYIFLVFYLEISFKKYKSDCKKLSGRQRGTCSYMCDR